MSTQNNSNKQGPVFTFDKQNYIFMAIGFVVILLGYILMAGGKADNPAVFSDAIFNTRRITLAPILIMIGFAIEVYAILKKPADNSAEKSDK